MTYNNVLVILRLTRRDVASMLGIANLSMTWNHVLIGPNPYIAFGQL